MLRPAITGWLKTLAAEYDMILVDTPPVLAASDALLFAPAVDGIILVLSTGDTAEQDAMRAKERLQQAGGNVLGVVLNRFDEKTHGSTLHPYGSARSSVLTLPAKAPQAGNHPARQRV